MLTPAETNIAFGSVGSVVLGLIGKAIYEGITSRVAGRRADKKERTKAEIDDEASIRKENREWTQVLMKQYTDTIEHLSATIDDLEVDLGNERTARLASDALNRKLDEKVLEQQKHIIKVTMERDALEAASYVAAKSASTMVRAIEDNIAKLDARPPEDNDSKGDAT